VISYFIRLKRKDMSSGHYATVSDTQLFTGKLELKITA
jgi:hypothetical protein